jgi:hypothetical protein
MSRQVIEAIYIVIGSQPIRGIGSPRCILGPVLETGTNTYCAQSLPKIFGRNNGTIHSAAAPNVVLNPPNQERLHIDDSSNARLGCFLGHLNEFLFKLHITPCQSRAFLGPNTRKNTEQVIRKQFQVSFNRCFKARHALIP